MDYATACIEDFETYLDKAVQTADALPPGEGGTLVLDGMQVIKGYYEKALLGLSATLGERTMRGQRCTVHDHCGEDGNGPKCLRPPRPIQYGRPNGALAGVIGGLSGSNLDIAMTWEARRIWEDVQTDNGPQRRPSGRFETTMPDQVATTTQLDYFCYKAVKDGQVVPWYQLNKISVPGMMHLEGQSIRADQDFSSAMKGKRGIEALRQFLHMAIEEQKNNITDTSGWVQLHPDEAVQA